MKKVISLLLIFLMLFPMLTQQTSALQTVANEAVEIKPYALHLAEKASGSISIAGVTYNDAYIFRMGYNGTGNGDFSEINYNFKGMFSSLTFYAGYYSGHQRDVTLSVIADGVTVMSKTIKYTDVAKKFTIDLTGVQHLQIVFNSIVYYDTTRYAVAQLTAVPAENYEESKTLSSNVFYNCEPYLYTNATAIKTAFNMGGYTYADGFDLRMGYTGTSTGGTSQLIFNFQEHYLKMSFDIACYGETHDYYIRPAQMTITADDNVVFDKTINWNDISQNIEIDLTGVSQLKIYTVSSGYDAMRYRIGNIQLKSDGIVRGILFKNTSGSVSTANPTFQTEPVVVPPDANNLNYTLTSDASIVAVVDENGLVTGRHSGTANIVATTEEGGFTATCKVKSTCPAARFVPSVNGWGFKNYQLTLSDLTDEYYNGIYQRISGRNLFYSLNTRRDLFRYADVYNYYYELCGFTGTGGLCAGMSITAALTYGNQIPFSSWKFEEIDPKTPADIKTITSTTAYSSAIDMQLKQFIYACYISQGTLASIIDIANNNNKYEDLIAAVKNFQNNGGIPVCIKLNNAHEVVGYEVIEKKESTEVYIYDSNIIKTENEDPDNIKITFTKNASGTITGWSYDNYNSKDDLSYRTNLVSIADRLKSSAVTETFLDFLTGTTAKKFSVQSGGKTVLSFNNGLFTKDNSQNTFLPLQLAKDNIASPSSDNAVFYSDTDEEVVITFEDDTDASIQTIFAGEDSAIVVECDGQSIIKNNITDSEKGIQVIPGKYKKIAVGYNTENKGMIFDGTVTNSLSVEVVEKNESVIVDGFDSLSISVIDDDGERLLQSLNTDCEKSYVIYDDGIVSEYALGDPDTDGKITSSDARLALRASVGLEKYQPKDKFFTACDIDKDGNISASDARYILRVAVGLDTM